MAVKIPIGYFALIASLWLSLHYGGEDGNGLASLDRDSHDRHEFGGDRRLSYNALDARAWTC